MSGHSPIFEWPASEIRCDDGRTRSSLLILTICIPKSTPQLVTNVPASALRGSNNLVRKIFMAKDNNQICRATTIRHHFLTNKVVPLWNRLPNTVTSAQTLNAFKVNLDVFMRDGWLIVISDIRLIWLFGFAVELGLARLPQQPLLLILLLFLVITFEFEGRG